MATKSKNTHGNPYHDESTGEFTSADKAGSSGAVESEQKPQIGTPTVSSQTIVKKRLKFKGSVSEVQNDLRLSKQVSSIPFLSSARDVEEHIEQFFTPEIIKNIDSKFGKFVVEYKYYNLRTDPGQRCGVNIFAACIGKKRWENNYLKLIDINEYNKLSSDFRYKKLFRGLNCDDKQFEIISDSYSSKENEMIYGSVGGTCYGIGVYASSKWDDAYSYAGYRPNHIMELVIDKNAKTMSYNSICRIRDELNYRKDSIVARVEKVFIDNGIEPSRAQKMARSFGITLGDEGFVAMLCGVEWYQGTQNYHIIQNLGSLYRLLKR